MGRYDVNTFMRRVNMHQDMHASYVADPAAAVTAWEALAEKQVEDPEPNPLGGTFTAEEREALIARDFGALYALGAHPYLLWSFTEAVWIHELPRAEIVRRFREAAAEVGYPDFAT
jgi:hypothetical protein